MAPNFSKDLGQDVSQLKRRSKEAMLFPWAKQDDVDPVLVKDARGALLTLDSGEVLIDMKAQAFSANLGYAHQGMIDAVTDAAKNMRVISSDTICPHRLGLAEDLVRIAPNKPGERLSKTFFTLGGAEANENAIKIARLFTGKHKIITRYRSYHGATLAMINFSGDYRRMPVDNAITGVVRFPDPYPRGSGQNIDTVRLLEEIIEIEGAKTIAAVLLEGITGANGVFVPPKDYWSRIKALCQKNAILLISDEVLSGFFRTGTWFGVNHFDVVPDIITMSKGLTAGYAPLGALMVSPQIARHFDQNELWCGLTQYGHPLSCATARAAIRFYEEDQIEQNVAARGSELKSQLEALKSAHDKVAEVRSIGLLAAIDLKKGPDDEAPLVPYCAQGVDLAPAQKLQKLLKMAGVAALVRFSTIILSPPLTISQSELSRGLQGVSQALEQLG